MGCPDTEPSSSPSRSRRSSHICTESRASLSPPSGDKAQSAQLSEAGHLHHAPQSTSRGGRTCSFWQAMLPDQKNTVSGSLTAWMLSKNDKELPDSACSEFPWGGWLSCGTFVIVDAHVHVPVVSCLLVKVCQEKGSSILVSSGTGELFAAGPAPCFPQQNGKESQNH